MKKKRLSKAVIASQEWYATLAAFCGASFTVPTMIALIDELVARLEIDSVIVLRYPQHASPQLLYGRADHGHRSNKIDDYLLGHYVLDPFYLRMAHCTQRGLTS